MAICRVCESELPTVRMPTSLGQAMWGGWDCPSCGAALDAKGRPLAARTEHADRLVFRSGLPPTAVERFQAEQDGAEAATADERARLQGLSSAST